MEPYGGVHVERVPEVRLDHREPMMGFEHERGIYREPFGNVRMEPFGEMHRGVEGVMLEGSHLNRGYDMHREGYGRDYREGYGHEMRHEEREMYREEKHHGIHSTIGISETESIFKSKKIIPL